MLGAQFVCQKIHAVAVLRHASSPDLIKQVGPYGIMNKTFFAGKVFYHSSFACSQCSGDPDNQHMVLAKISVFISVK